MRQATGNDEKRRRSNRVGGAFGGDSRRTFRIGLCGVVVASLLAFMLASVPLAGPAQAQTVEIGQTELGNVFVRDARPTFEVTTSASEVNWKIRDYWGGQVSSGTLAVPGASATLKPPLGRNGYYELDVSVGGGGSAQTTFAIVPPEGRAGVEDFVFGMQSHFGQASGGWNAAVTPLIATAGVEAVRDAQPWQIIEVDKGVYDFTVQNGRFETYMAELKKHGIEPVSAFGLANDNYDNGATPHSTEGHRAFGRFAAEVLKHYGDQVQRAGVYNEPNLLKFGDYGDGPADALPENYFKLLRATHNAIDAERPDVTVAGPELAAGVGRVGTWKPWLEEFFQLGGLDYLDVVSVHPYRIGNQPEGLAGHLNHVRELMDQYGGGNKPLWITEQGWPTDRVSKEEQASVLPRTYVLGIAAGVERFNWYNFMDTGRNSFGVIHGGNDPLGRFVPKPSFVAFTVMTKQLSGTTYQARDKAPAGVHSHRFGTNARPLRVMWSQDGNQNVSLKTQEPVRVSDAMGATRTLEPVNGQVSLTLTDNVTYVRGNINAIVQGGKFGMEATDSALSEDVPATIRLDNSGAERPLEATYRVAGEKYTLSAPAGEVAEKDIMVTKGGRTGARTIFGDVKVDDKRAGMVAAGVTINEDLDIAVKPAVNDVGGQEVGLAVDVTNNLRSQRTIDQLDWSVGDSNGNEPLDLTLQPSETKTVDVALPSEFAYWTPFPYAVTIGGAGHPPVEQEGELGFDPVPTRTLAVDGDVSELSNVVRPTLQDHGTVERTNIGVPYDGPTDLSGPMWLTADQDNLYVAGQVTDDVYLQGQSGATTWQADSIQFGLAKGLPGSGREFYEYAVALTDNGPEVFRHSAAGDEPTGPTDDEVAIVRDEQNKTTTYEVAVPWADLGVIDPVDGWFSYSMLVNDDDGDGREGWIEWGSGIGSGKNPSLFNPMHLVGQ